MLLQVVLCQAQHDQVGDPLLISIPVEMVPRPLNLHLDELRRQIGRKLDWLTGPPNPKTEIIISYI